MRAKITGTGLYAPPRVETAAELAPRLGVTEEWIREQTGVIRRHIADETVDEMAVQAARRALGGGPPPDLVIYAAATVRQTIPDTSVYVMKGLGLSGTPGFSIHATCLSFVVAVHNAYALAQVGAYKRILVVSAELGSKGRIWTEPDSAALLGDGAGAAIVEPVAEGDTSELLAYEMSTWPEHAHLAVLPGGGSWRHPNDPATVPNDNLFHMDGPGIYKAARKRVAIVLARVLQKAGMTKADIALTVPHQPSGPAVAALAHYGIPAERTMNTIGEYGNCIAASIPMALAQADAEGRLHRGDVVLLIGTGAGLSVGAAVLRW